MKKIYQNNKLFDVLAGDMVVCESCEQKIKKADSYCPHCGASLSDSTAVLTDDVENQQQSESEFTKVDDPQPKPGLIESFVPYFLPFSSNELEMKRRFGGCPGCGEGREVEFKQSSARSFIGDPTAADINCARCGTELETKGTKFTVVDGFPDLVDEELSMSDCSNLASAHREGDTERIQELVADITGEKVEKETKQIEKQKPRFPILSVFAALLIARTGFYSLGTAGNPVDGVFFLLLAVLIVPRVRRRVDSVFESATGWSLRSTLFQVVAGLVYVLLVGVSVLLLIGQAVRDPAMSAAAGLVSVVVPLVLAVVIVFAIRLVR